MVSTGSTTDIKSNGFSPFRGEIIIDLTNKKNLRGLYFITFYFLSLQTLLYICIPFITRKNRNIMSSWFQCKVKYDRNGEDGNFTSVNEVYLVDAMSFTEAEKRITEELKPFVSGEFNITDIKRKRIAELFENNEGDIWYLCKVMFITLDEEKGVEKRTASFMLSQGENLKEALDVLINGMKGTLAQYEIASITETPIMDVLKLQVD